MSKTDGVKHLCPFVISGDEMQIRFLYWSFEADNVPLGLAPTFSADDRFNKPLLIRKRLIIQYRRSAGLQA